MYILSLHIREFGGLSDLSLNFSDGLNLISGNNESGKSTLISFIRFMLYGFPKRGAGEALSDSERAYSWNSGIADGSLTLSHDQKIYRIERREQLGSTKKQLQIIDEASGQPVHKGEIPGLLFLGFPVQVFDSTACIRQLRAGQLDGDGLSSAIENLLLTGDESVNTEKALDNLDKARKVLLHKNGRGGELYRLDCEIADLSEALNRLRDASSELKETALRKEELQKQIAEAEEALTKEEQHCNLFRDAQILNRFDALHTEHARLTGERKNAALLTETHNRNGFLPNIAYIQTLEAHAQRLEADERNAIRADAEKRIAAEAPMANETLLTAAQSIRNLGGKSAIMARALQLQATKKSASLLQAVCFPLGIVSLLLGILLTILIGNPLLLSISLGAFAMIGGAVGWSKKRQADRSLAALFSAIGFSEKPETFESTFPTLADRAFREEDHAARRSDRIAAAEAAAAEAKESERLHRIEAANAAYRILPYGESITPDTLRSLSASLRTELAERDRCEHMLSVYEQNYRRMSSELESFDEEALRKKIPEGFDYKHIEDAHSSQERRDRAKMRLSALEEERLAVERRLSALEATVTSPEVLTSTIDEKQRTKAELESRLRGILLAAESISLARDGLKSRISPRLRSDAAKYLAILSNGKYGTLSLDHDFAVSGEENGRVHPADAFSGGTKDAMYLSLRLALTDLLTNGKAPLPILLDEALAQLDDTRAEALLSILLARAENGGQALFFTCHSRETAILTGKAVNHIHL